MKLGVQLIHQSANSLRELGKAADGSRFDGVWLAGGGDNYLKAATLLVSTSRITVGTSIVPVSCLALVSRQFGAFPAVHVGWALHPWHGIAD